MPSRLLPSVDYESMEESTSKSLYFLINLLLIAPYTFICGISIVDWHLGEGGVFLLIILPSCGILLGIWQVILYSLSEKTNDIFLFLISPGLFGAIALTILFLNYPESFKDLNWLKALLSMICYGLIISIYHSIFRYMLCNKYRCITTSLVMLFSIPSIFWLMELLF